MRILLFLGALVIALPAAAQNPPSHGANIDPAKLDEAAKARLRVEGAAGGIPEGGASGAMPASQPSASAGGTAKPATTAERTQADKPAVEPKAGEQRGG